MGYKLTKVTPSTGRDEKYLGWFNTHAEAYNSMTKRACNDAREKGVPAITHFTDYNTMAVDYGEEGVSVIYHIAVD